MECRVTFTLPPGVAESALPPAAYSAAAQSTGGRVTLHAREPMPLLHALSSWAIEHGYHLADIEVQRPTLEDVYLQLTWEGF